MENVRRSVPTYVLIAALMAASCARSGFTLAQASVDDGGARAALQAKLDATRQCAEALSGYDPPAYDLEASLASVAALRAAGLIEPAPDEAGRRAYRPTELGRRSFVYRPTPGAPGRRFVTLCYGRRHVGRVWLRSHGKTDPLPYLNYTYHVDEAPEWTRRPAIRAAFPFLSKVYGREWTDDDSSIFFDKGRWTFDELDTRILGMSAENSFTDLGNVGHGS